MSELPSEALTRIKDFVTREAAHRWMAIGESRDLAKLAGGATEEDVPDSITPDMAGRLLFYAHAMLQQCPGVFNLLPDARSSPTFLSLSPGTQFDVFINAPVHIAEAVALHNWMNDCAISKSASFPCKSLVPEEGKPVILTNRDL